MVPVADAVYDAQEGVWSSTFAGFGTGTKVRFNAVTNVGKINWSDEGNGFI